MKSKSTELFPTPAASNCSSPSRNRQSASTCTAVLTIMLYMPRIKNSIKILLSYIIKRTCLFLQEKLLIHTKKLTKQLILLFNFKQFLVKDKHKCYLKIFLNNQIFYSSFSTAQICLSSKIIRNLHLILQLPKS